MVPSSSRPDTEPAVRRRTGSSFASASEHLIDWSQHNQPIELQVFNALWERVQDYLADQETFVSELHVGADPMHYLPIHVTTQFAWHALFANALFIDPERYNPSNKGVWEIVNAAEFVCDPTRDGTNSDGTVMICFSQKRVLLAGMRYAGEMK